MSRAIEIKHTTIGDFINRCESYLGSDDCKSLYVTVSTKKPPVVKTNKQLRYLHKIIDKYLTQVLFDTGNIDVNSEKLAKLFIKERCGFGEKNIFKFKGEIKERFIDKSFADASKEEIAQMIEVVIKICAIQGVFIPPTSLQPIDSY